MKFEDLTSESPEIKLSGIQNDIFADNPMHQGMLAEVSFTGDAAESGSEFSGFRSFRNDIIDVQVGNFEKGGSDSGRGDYYGPSSDALEMKMDRARKDLETARDQLDRAIKNGVGVITAMTLVESRQKLLDTYTQQYSKAVEAEASRSVEMMSASAAESGEGGEQKKLGSVSHATWELEQAYKSGNSIAIENAKKNLAHEKAKEEAKK